MKWSDSHDPVGGPSCSWLSLPAPQFLGDAGEPWVSQVPDISLPTCHALGTPPESPGTRHCAPLLLASTIVTVSPSGLSVYEADSLQRGASLLRPMGFSVYASVMSFGFLLPSYPQDSIRIGGLTRDPSGFRLQGAFGRDFHPARDAKLRLAHNDTRSSRAR